MRSPHTAMKSSPRSLQLEKARAQQRRPNAAINKWVNEWMNNKKKIKVTGRPGALEPLIAGVQSDKMHWQAVTPWGVHGASWLSGGPVCFSWWQGLFKREPRPPVLDDMQLISFLWESNQEDLITSLHPGDKSGDNSPQSIFWFNGSVHKTS